MTEEDEEFNRIEREAAMRKAAVSATVKKRKWVGLTRAERSELWQNMDWGGMPEHSYGKAIEKLLKEKNEM